MFLATLVVMALVVLACIGLGQNHIIQVSKGPGGQPIYANVSPSGVIQAVPSMEPKEAKHVRWRSSFVLFPADTNAQGSGFGGKLLAEMDRTAAIAARRFLYDGPYRHRDAVTVGVDKVKFVNPASVKDLLLLEATVVKAGEKSITIKVVVERELYDCKRELICEGTFTFVAFADNKAQVHGLKVREADDE